MNKKLLLGVVALFLVLAIYQPTVEASLSIRNATINLTANSSQLSGVLTNQSLVFNGSNINTSHAFWTSVQSDGDDIIFTDVTDNILCSELVHFDGTNKHFEAHIKFNTTNASTTRIQLQYGNATATRVNDTCAFETDKKLVYHLSEVPTNTFKDSTNNNNGTSSGFNSSDQVTGQIYNGTRFDQTNNFISAGDVSSYAFVSNTANFTISFWLKQHDLSGDEGIIGNEQTSAEKGFLIYKSGGSLKIDMYNGSGTPFNFVMTNAISVNDTNYAIDIVGNTTHVLGYVNGSLFDTSVNLDGLHTGNATRVLNIGRMQGSTPSNYANITLDEMWVVNRGLSANEILTQYNNHKTNSQFWTVSDQIVHATDASPTVTLNSPTNNTSTTTPAQTFNFTATDDKQINNATLFVYFTNGSQLTTVANTSVVSNNTANTIAYTFGFDGTYYWNVKAFDNNSQSSFATNNFTINVGVPPISINETSDTANQTSGFLATWKTIVLFLFGKDDTQLNTVFLETNETGTATNYSTRFVQDFYQQALNDSSTSKDVVFSGTENKTVYLRLPKSATAITARTNVTKNANWSVGTVSASFGDVGTNARITVFNRSGTTYMIAGKSDGTFSGFNWTGTAWQSDANIVSGLGDVGDSASPTVFNFSNTQYLITGETFGTFSGFNWTGTAWQSDANIVSGLGDVGSESKPTVFNRSGTTYMIAGESAIDVSGFNWTGTAWQSDANIVSGISGIGTHAYYAIFNLSTTQYMVVGDGSGTFSSFNWTGTAWQSDANINAGILDVGSHSSPHIFNISGTQYLFIGDALGTLTTYVNWTGTAWQSEVVAQRGFTNIFVTSDVVPFVFNKSGTMYLVNGYDNGTFSGFNWTGTAWQSDANIVSGLGDVGSDSAPTVFNFSNTQYLITGETFGTFSGFNWTGTAWQNDTNIVSGLSTIGNNSAPTVFNRSGTTYMIAGKSDGTFSGFNWTGTAWQSDANIVSGLGDVGGFSKPSVFNISTTMYLVAGNSSGYLSGFNWTGTAWQSDTRILNDIRYLDTFIAPTVFNLSSTRYILIGTDVGLFRGFVLFNPSNVYIDTANSESPNEFNLTESPLFSQGTASLNTTLITSYLSTCTVVDASNNCDVPILIHSDTAGTITLDNIVVALNSTNYSQHNFTWANASANEGKTIQWKAWLTDNSSQTATNSTSYLTFTINTKPIIDSFALNISTLDTTPNNTLTVFASDSAGGSLDKFIFNTTVATLASGTATIDINDFLTQTGTLIVNDTISDNSSSKTLNYSIVNGSLTQNTTFANNISVQRVSKSSNLTNNGNTMSYNLTHTNVTGASSTVRQNETGTSTASTSLIFYHEWEGDWLTESQSTWSQNSTATSNLTTQIINSTVRITNNGTIALNSIAYTEPNSCPTNFSCDSLTGTYNVPTTGNTTNYNGNGDILTLTEASFVQDTSESTTANGTAYVQRPNVTVNNNGTINFTSVQLNLANRTSWNCDEKTSTGNFSAGNTTLSYPINCTATNIILAYNSTLNTTDTNVTVGEIANYQVNITVNSTDTEINYTNAVLNASSYIPTGYTNTSFSNLTFNINASQSTIQTVNLTGMRINETTTTLGGGCPSGFTDFSTYCRKSDTQLTLTRYQYRSFMNVSDNSSKLANIRHPVPKSRLPDFSSATNIQIDINDIGTNINYDQNSSHFIFVIYNNFSTSSLSNGTHFGDLQYDVPISNPPSSGGGGGGTPTATAGEDKFQVDPIYSFADPNKVETTLAFTLAKGESKRATLRIENQDTKDLNITMYVEQPQRWKDSGLFFGFVGNFGQTDTRKTVTVAKDESSFPDYRIDVPIDIATTVGILGGVPYEATLVVYSTNNQGAIVTTKKIPIKISVTDDEVASLSKLQAFLAQEFNPFVTKNVCIEGFAFSSADVIEEPPCANPFRLTYGLIGGTILAGGIWYFLYRRKRRRKKYPSN